jgi:hypothetical protein
MSTAPPVKRTLFVHIGVRKSGTSYLQATTYASVEALAGQGIGVPFPGWERHYDALYRPLLEIQPGQEPPQSALDGLARARAVCDRTPGDRLLLSFEDLAALSPTQIEAFLGAFAGYDIHIVVTTRDLARQIPSEWQQCVKERLVTPFGEYVAALRSREGPDSDQFWRRQEVRSILSRWATGIPDDHVHVIVVPPSGAPRSLLPDLYYRLLGVDPATLSPPSRSVNRSLGYVEAEALRRVNSALGDQLPDRRSQYRLATRRVLRGTLLRHVGPGPAIPSEHREWVFEESQRQAEWLSQQRCDVLGSVDDLVSAKTSQDAGKLSVSDSEVAEVAVEALARLSVQRVEAMQRAKSPAVRRRTVRDRLVAWTGIRRLAKKLR